MSKSTESYFRGLSADRPSTIAGGAFKGSASVEPRAFCKAMGCVEVEVYNQEHVRAEPFDRQLERSL